MSKHILDDYLDALKLQLRHLPLSQQRQVLAEVRAHLEQDIDGRLAEDKRLSKDEAALQATHGFGDPKDIGVAYGANGGLVRKSTGEVLLHVAVLTGRGVARTVRTTVKWTGIALLVILVLATAAAIAAAFIASDLIQEYKDEIVESIPRPVYGYQGNWSLPDAQASMRTDTFQVSTDARGFDLRFDVQPTHGCLQLVVTAPDGSVAYQSGQGCSAYTHQMHGAQQGSWRIQYTFLAFTGRVNAEAYEYLESNTA